MAAVKGVNVTKYDAGGQGDNAIGQGLIHSNLEVWTETYEAASLATASTIDIAILPAGATIIDVLVANDALGGSTSFTIGDSTDADRYVTVSDSSSAGVARLDAIAGLHYEIGTNTGDERVIITTSGTTTGTIQTAVLYTR